jgi:hypothetical protein
MGSDSVVSPQIKMKMVGQDHNGVHEEGMIAPRLAERLAQLSDVPYQKIVAAALGKTDREKIPTARNSCPRVGSHNRSLAGIRLDLIPAYGLSDQRSRIGIHGVLGGMTIPEWIEFFLLHEAHHLYVAMQRARGG